MATRIIFISGVGDRKRWFYDLVAWRWKLLGFRTSAFIFGWDSHRSDFETQFAKLLDFIDKFPDDKICLVGISAGGTAAFNALIARPECIAKVAMVSSPFQKHTYTHRMLLESIRRANDSFEKLNFDVKPRLLAVTGHRDQTVPPALSLLREVERKYVLGFTHGASIVMATLIQTGALRRFLTRE
jgi:pimeloyl-ACP methyl ester carboxylesterase